MAKLKHIDGIILRWGDRHDSQLKPGRIRQPAKTGIPRPKRKPPQVKRALTSLAKKKPQVMVKVTGGGRSMQTIRAHFKYIQKHGTVELENQAGERLTGEAIDDELELWRTGGYGIRKTEKTKDDLAEGEKLQPREAVNMVLSMPKGTDPEKLKEAVRDFAQENFADKHEYVFGLHTDRDHPHVHLAIKSRSFVDLRRLDTRKEKIQQYRESFVEHLYQHGIEAATTPRATRNELSYKRVFRQNRERSYDIYFASGRRPETVNMKSVAGSERRDLYRAVRALSNSDNADDRAIADIFRRSVNLKFFDNGEYINESRKQSRRYAAVLQSRLGESSPGRTPNPNAGLRDLSGINVVRDGPEGHQVLLR
jgi:hypothetical protein